MTRSALALVVVALGTSGCFVPVPEGPHQGIEGTEDTCHDHIDNNGNHMVDCRDPGCLEHGFCNQIIPLNRVISPEGRTPGTVCSPHITQADCDGDPSGRCIWYPPPSGATYPGSCSIHTDPVVELATCDDQIDNDDDGHFDCGDPGCQGVYETCCIVEVSNDVCRNLVDDDGNGFADCEENSCRHPQYDFVTACSTETWIGQPGNCRNHLDDDRDHYLDCADKECLGDPLCTENCTNGVDDNDDHRADCLDPRCFGMPGPGGAMCPTIIENTAELCSDGIDNDGNEYVDCADRGCGGIPDPPAPAAQFICNREHTLEACSDGMDNDLNGYVDCADFSCTRTSNGAMPDAVAFCTNFIATHGEASFGRCTDGIDNDSNGYADCGDFSCIHFSEMDPNSPASAPTLRSPCQESFGTDAMTNCSDGRDNDADGFVDCEDWDCNHNPATTVYCAMMRGMRGEPLVCGSYPCLTNANCSGVTTPICDLTSGACRGCIGDGECRVPAAPVCDRMSGACRGCMNDSECHDRDQRLTTCAVMTGLCT